MAQFTLAADTRKGRRPSFAPAGVPAVGETLFAYLVERAREHREPAGSGIFGADRKVGRINAGLVTFWLRASPEARGGERDLVVGLLSRPIRE